MNHLTQFSWLIPAALSSWAVAPCCPDFSLRPAVKPQYLLHLETFQINKTDTGRWCRNEAFMPGYISPLATSWMIWLIWQQHSWAAKCQWLLSCLAWLLVQFAGCTRTGWWLYGSTEGANQIEIPTVKCNPKLGWQILVLSLAQWKLSEFRVWRTAGWET